MRRATLGASWGVARRDGALREGRLELLDGAAGNGDRGAGEGTWRGQAHQHRCARRCDRSAHHPPEGTPEA
jgi:hypothetical protein